MSAPQLRAALAALALLACAARAGAAVIEGRVSHPTRTGAAANLLVEALGLDPQEHPISRQTHTDKDGRYRFDDLPAPAAYLVRAEYGGLTFPGGSTGFRQGEEAKRATLDFKIYDQSADASRLRIAQLQWVAMKSAGVWRVSESANVANPDEVAVVIPPSAPTPIRVALAPGHGVVDTVFGHLPEGATVVGDAVEVRGPVLPGDQGLSVQVEYDLEPAADGGLVTDIAIPSPVDDLAVYVQDSGIAVDAGELHPARPARQDDAIFQAFIGFDVPAGTRLPLRVVPLPPGRPLPQALVAAIAALAAGALFFFVIAPVVRVAIARGATRNREPESPAKAALAAALADLEHDFETGKLSVEDRERLRADLRREAMAALARERLGPATDEEPAGTKPCTCGRVPAAGDRFCAACGNPL